MNFKPVELYTNAEEFVSQTIDEFQRVAGSKGRSVGLSSGGVDSTGCGLIAYRALGKRFHGIHFEHGGMRKGECKDVLWNLNSACKLLVTYRDFTENFMPRVIKAGEDAEKKREAVSETYFEVGFQLAKEHEADIFIHGTIKPDWLETKKGIKRQHNVVPEHWLREFEKENIVIAEPLYHRYKPEVRDVLKYLGAPPTITERQPFPGPGLFCRVIGQVTEDKMKVLKTVDSIATSELESSMNVYKAQGKDVQYLVGLMERKTEEIDIPKSWSGVDIENPRITKDKVTGMVGDKRTYKNLLLFNAPAIPVEPVAKASCEIIEKNEDIGRCAVVLKERDRGKYIGIIRAVTTKDFTTAQVAELPAGFVHLRQREIMLRAPAIGILAYDVTPKPPGTIEFE